MGGGLRLMTGMRQAISDLLAPSCCREIEPGQVQPDGLRGKLCDLGGREEGGTARARPRGPVRRLGGGGHDLSREPLAVLPAAELRTRHLSPTCLSPPSRVRAPYPTRWRPAHLTVQHSTAQHKTARVPTLHVLPTYCIYLTLPALISSYFHLYSLSVRRFCVWFFPPQRGGFSLGDAEGRWSPE